MTPCRSLGLADRVLIAEEADFVECFALRYGVEPGDADELLGLRRVVRPLPRVLGGWEGFQARAVAPRVGTVNSPSG